MLSIVIVHYKTPHLLLDCLRSVFAETKHIDFEVLVVDNDSQDQSQALILSAFPQVKWFDMGYNAGFARANNLGIRYALQHNHVDSLLLLNSDTIVLEGAIEKCYTQLLQTSSAAGGSVQLLNSDYTPQITGNYAMTGGLNYLLPLPYLGPLLRKIALSLKVSSSNLPEATQTEKVDWINGAFLMVKTSAIQKAGLLDEDFFLYAEETEWCSRIRQFGDLLVFGDLKTLHLQGVSANQTFQSGGQGYFNLFDKKGKQIMVSNLVRIRKEFGIGWFLFITTFYTLTIPIFFIGLLFESIFQMKSQLHWKQWKGYTQNVFFLLKISPIILRNKPYFYKVL